MWILLQSVGAPQDLKVNCGDKFTCIVYCIKVDLSNEQIKKLDMSRASILEMNTRVKAKKMQFKVTPASRFL